MGIKSFFTNVKGAFSRVTPQTSEFDITFPGTVNFTEAFKGQVNNINKNYPVSLGEEHMFDFAMMDTLYSTFGLATATIDKYVDYIVGPGYFLKVEEEDELAQKAKIIIEDWMQDINFDTLLRQWTKEALKKGSGFIELGDEEILKAKILNASYMYIKRDEFGEVEAYNQYVGGFKQFDKTQVISFEPNEVAHIAFNKVGDYPYGIGILFPTLKTTDAIVGNEAQLSMLLKRKANSPIHAKLGDKEKGIIPSTAALAAFGQKMEWLNNKHEWATGPNVDMKVLDFGNVGEKFNSILEYEQDMYFYTTQIPEVIMGKGSVPEGLAKVQMKGFMMRVQSFQAEIEKVVETQIFKRILNVNGIDAHVELEWGSPDEEESNARLDKVGELMKTPMVSPAFFTLLEAEAVKLLELDVDKYEQLQKELGPREEPVEEPPENVEREEEETAALPLIPGQQRQSVDDKDLHTETCTCDICEEGDVFKEYSLQEWLGFNYKTYIEDIQDVIAADDFKLLKAVTQQDVALGKLKQGQIYKLRNIMHVGFTEGKSVRWIQNEIKRTLGLSSAYKKKEGKLVKTVDKGLRPNLIARTEATRFASQGALKSYSKKGVKKVRWVSSLGERTCEQCSAMNGEIFTLSEANGQIPLHVACRCTFSPVTELD